MIASLQGILQAKETGRVIVDVQGVGYRVEISLQTYEHLPPSGERVRLWIHHHITDSDQRLFGFFETGEQNLFERLITVKGVGPKLALTILSGMSAADLVEAIVDQDMTSLSRVPGIGKKSAERIILELKDKILEGDAVDAPASGGAKGDLLEEAVSALEALGFRKREAEKSVMELLRRDEKIDVPDLVKQVLRQRSS